MVGGISEGGGGVTEGDMGSRFGVGQTFALKHYSGKCIYPDSSIELNGTFLVGASKCGDSLALFTQTDSGLLKHVRTGFCVKPRDGKMGDNVELTISSDCEGTKWGFTMTSDDSLKLVEDGRCVHPLGGQEYPVENNKFVFHRGCDEPKLSFTIQGTVHDNTVQQKSKKI